MTKKSVIVIITVLFSVVAYSQPVADKVKNNKYFKLFTKPKRDTTYIGKFPQKLSIKPFIGNRVYKFNIRDAWNATHEINYKPNVNNRLGLTVRYKGFSLGFSLPLPTNDYIYGKTNSFNLYLNTQFSFINWGTDFFYVRNKGFYLSNAGDILSFWKAGSPYPTRPDLLTVNAGLTSHMVFSRKFSMKAALYQTEKQLKPAGGISLGTALRFTRVKADSSLIPESQIPYFQDIKTLTSGGFLTIALAPGYSYTYVYKDFFITGMALIGLGLQIQGYRLKPNKLSGGLRLSAYNTFRLAAGYNADKIFGSIVYHYSNNNIKVKDSRMGFSYQGVSLNFGMRFF